MRVLDLTLTISDGMPGVEVKPRHRRPQDAWNSSVLSLYSHCGTHMDSPAHLNSSDSGIDLVPLEQCYGPAWVLRVPNVAPRSLILVEHLGSIAEQLQPGDGLLIATGWSSRWGTPGYREALPRISRELALWCVNRQVRVLGVEPPSVADVNNRQEVEEIHGILLKGGVIIVEGLTNLEAISKPRVIFAAFPLKIQGGDGSPVRAVAFEE
ncbi:MAG TPA: cyclase family protein [Thermogutta sp.]|nr:cyclase family protein [Thermogutta sp.]HOP78173.1 cyclase family protein [Thermogutta sp.]HPU06845.1 cyclase family protein [Thermogutta sp.]HQF13239.1 cyclase family protein [Thermogutta sp.]